MSYTTKVNALDNEHHYCNGSIIPDGYDNDHYVDPVNDMIAYRIADKENIKHKPKIEEGYMSNLMLNWTYDYMVDEDEHVREWDTIDTDEVDLEYKRDYDVDISDYCIEHTSGIVAYEYDEMDFIEDVVNRRYIPTTYKEVNRLMGLLFNNNRSVEHLRKYLLIVGAPIEMVNYVDWKFEEENKLPTLSNNEHEKVSYKDPIYTDGVNDAETITDNTEKSYKMLTFERGMIKWLPKKTDIARKVFYSNINIIDEEEREYWDYLVDGTLELSGKVKYLILNSHRVLDLDWVQKIGVKCGSIFNNSYMDSIRYMEYIKTTMIIAKIEILTPTNSMKQGRIMGIITKGGKAVRKIERATFYEHNINQLSTIVQNLKKRGVKIFISHKMPWDVSYKDTWNKFRSSYSHLKEARV